MISPHQAESRYIDITCWAHVQSIVANSHASIAHLVIPGVKALTLGGIRRSETFGFY